MTILDFISRVGGKYFVDFNYCIDKNHKTLLS